MGGDVVEVGQGGSLPVLPAFHSLSGREYIYFLGFKLPGNYLPSYFQLHNRTAAVLCHQASTNITQHGLGQS